MVRLGRRVTSDYWCVTSALHTNPFHKSFYFRKELRDFINISTLFCTQVYLQIPISVCPCGQIIPFKKIRMKFRRAITKLHRNATPDFMCVTCEKVTHYTIVTLRLHPNYRRVSRQKGPGAHGPQPLRVPSIAGPLSLVSVSPGTSAPAPGPAPACARRLHHGPGQIPAPGEGLRPLFGPLRRIAGRTSEVTHFRKGFASGLSERRISVYRPLSLMTVISWTPPGVSIKSTPFSSSSSRLEASRLFWMPKIRHTSDSAHQTSPRWLMALTLWSL